MKSETTFRKSVPSLFVNLRNEILTEIIASNGEHFFRSHNTLQYSPALNIARTKRAKYSGVIVNNLSKFSLYCKVENRKRGQDSFCDVADRTAIIHVSDRSAVFRLNSHQSDRVR